MEGAVGVKGGLESHPLGPQCARNPPDRLRIKMCSQIPEKHAGGMTLRGMGFTEGKRKESTEVIPSMGRVPSTGEIHVDAGDH